MEVEAARIMFERLFRKYKLSHINVLRDGESQAHLALTQDKVYGYMVVKKQEQALLCATFARTTSRRAGN